MVSKSLQKVLAVATKPENTVLLRVGTFVSPTRLLSNFSLVNMDTPFYVVPKSLLEVITVLKNFKRSLTTAFLLQYRIQGVCNENDEKKRNEAPLYLSVLCALSPLTGRVPSQGLRRSARTFSSPTVTAFSLKSFETFEQPNFSINPTAAEDDPLSVGLHQVGFLGFMVSLSVVPKVQLCVPATRWVSSVMMFRLLVAICVKLIHCLKDSYGQSKWP